MQAELVHMMRSHVRAIHRAITGTDVPEGPQGDPGARIDPNTGEPIAGESSAGDPITGDPAVPPDDIARRFLEPDDIARRSLEPDDITRRFLELDAAARSIPAVRTMVPPFAFTPPLDVIASDTTVVLELALPGVRREDVDVVRRAGGLVVHGVRRDGVAGRAFHSEIPRGPFSRAIPLPFPVEDAPRIELEHGVLRIHLAVGAAGATEALGRKHREGE